MVSLVIFSLFYLREDQENVLQFFTQDRDTLSVYRKEKKRQ